MARFQMLLGICNRKEVTTWSEARLRDNSLHPRQQQLPISSILSEIFLVVSYKILEDLIGVYLNSEFQLKNNKVI